MDAFFAVEGLADTTYGLLCGPDASLRSETVLLQSGCKVVADVAVRPSGCDVRDSTRGFMECVAARYRALQVTKEFCRLTLASDFVCELAGMSSLCIYHF